MVASFTSFRYLRAGMFRWRTLWPFLLGRLSAPHSVPMILKAPGFVLIVAGLKLIGVYGMKYAAARLTLPWRAG